MLKVILLLIPFLINCSESSFEINKKAIKGAIKEIKKIPRQYKHDQPYLRLSKKIKMLESENEKLKNDNQALRNDKETLNGLLLNCGIYGGALEKKNTELETKNEKLTGLIQSSNVHLRQASIILNTFFVGLSCQNP